MAPVKRRTAARKERESGSESEEWDETQENGNDGSSVEHVLIFLMIASVVCLLVGVSFIYFKSSIVGSFQNLSTKLPQSKLKGNTGFKIIGDIPHIKWDNSFQSYAAEVIKDRLPYVIEKSPARKWKALKTWSFDGLGNVLPKTLVNVRSSKVRVFVAAQDKPGQVPAPQRKDVFAMKNMTYSEFMASPTQHGNLTYYTGHLEHLGRPVRRDIDPEVFKLGEKEISHTSIWLSHAGVIANTHYDRSHNFVTTVLGSKRWFLFPPTEWRWLYHYPHLHPHYQQSQADYPYPNTQVFPRAQDAEAYVAVVKPGDVLYVPPYWSHRVETINTTLAVSIISPSEEEMLCGDMMSVDLPLETTWSQSKRASYVRYFMLLVLELLHQPETQARAEGKKAGKTEAELGEPRWTGFIKHMMIQTRFAAYDSPGLPADVTCDVALESQDQSKMDTLAEHVASIVHADLPIGVGEICLGNLYEELARYVAGAANVLGFFKHCVVTS